MDVQSMMKQRDEKSPTKEKSMTIMGWCSAISNQSI